jgi:hypothetical protein
MQINQSNYHMVEKNAEYYWLLSVEKHKAFEEKRNIKDMEDAIKAFYKLMEIEPAYGVYCHSRKDKPEDFLIPNIDYYWWRDNIQNKGNLYSM